ncbi:MAG: CvpA family protein [Clostridia bacterium]|nr:CvpA family protein [Clostridia bacterium]
MGAIIDIIIVAIIAYTIIMAVKKGFVKTVIGALGFFLAIAIAVAFCGPLADFLEEGGFGTSVSRTVDDLIDSNVDEENYEGIFNNEDGEESVLLKICKTFGAADRYDDMSDNYNEWRDAGIASAREYLKTSIKGPAVDLCCGILAFLLVFVAAWILLKVAEIVIGKAVDLPVLKQANKLLGAISGVILAVVRVYIACLVIKWLVPVAGSFGWEWALNVDLTDSYLFNAFESVNFLSYLI